MKSGHGDKMSRKHEIAIVALLTEPTLKQAAKKAGIGEATLWRWMQDLDFAKQYRVAKRQAVSQAISKLQQACGEAVDTLCSIMKDEEAPAPSRVSAAKAVLDTAIKAIEIEELESRIEELERLQETNRLKGVR